MPFDEEKVRAFAAKMFVDLGGASSVALALAGDRLGLWKGMAGAGPLTPAELAARTSTAERYVREWLVREAAAEYVTYDAASGRYTLPDEQRAGARRRVQPGDGSRRAAVQSASSVKARGQARRRVPQRRGGRLGRAPSRSVPGHRALLPSRLQRQPGRPSGFRRSTASRRSSQRARASPTSAAVTVRRRSSWRRRIPQSTLRRLRLPRAVDRARAPAARPRPGVADRVALRGGDGEDVPGHGYDLVAFFDCLHDMGDPVGAAAHVREALAPDGTWLLVEPFANDRIEDNLNPIGRVFYAASTDLHARLAVAGGRARARRAGGRSAAARGGHAGGLHALPSRHRDAVQPGVRSAPVARPRRALTTLPPLGQTLTVFPFQRRHFACCSKARSRSSPARAAASAAKKRC